MLILSNTTFALNNMDSNSHTIEATADDGDVNITVSDEEHDVYYIHEQQNIIEVMIDGRVVDFIVSAEEYIFYQENGVFEWELNVGQQGESPSMAACVHSRQTPAWPEAQHPHYFYNRCLDCNQYINTGVQTIPLAGCSICMHTCVQSGLLYNPSDGIHPHPVYRRRCTTTTCSNYNIKDYTGTYQYH